jgi:hypothetical protein
MPEISHRRKNILLTFDYEPFLGARSGTPRRCLTEPTNALLETVSKWNLKCVFFVDTLYLVSLERHNGATDELKEIKDQLIRLFREGHYVFPHIHPHWMDAAYDSNTGQFSLGSIKRYSLSAFSEAEAEVFFAASISYLEALGIRYDTWGYRAGGWCIQPFSRYAAAFKKNRISYEFSVLPRHANREVSQAFDYLHVTYDRPYRFDSRIEIEEKNGPFAEFPISVIRFGQGTNILDRVIRKVLWKMGDRGWGDGLSGQVTGPVSPQGLRMVSLDALTMAQLPAYYAYVRDSDYMHWLTHPKMLTKHSLRCFGRFFRNVCRKYDVESDFRKMIQT